MIDANRNALNPLVVSICGPSNAGKSQLAKATAVLLGETVASRVPVDYFVVPRDQGESLAEFHARPMRWDWPLLSRRLALPMGTRTSTPDADFETFRRRGDVGGLPFAIRPVMLCDAMEPFPGSDLVVELDVPREERQRRIVERDARWGTRVADRIVHLDATWREASADVRPDLTLDGTLPLSRLAAELAGTIRRMVASSKEQEP